MNKRLITLVLHLLLLLLVSTTTVFAAVPNNEVTAMNIVNSPSMAEILYGPPHLVLYGPPLPQFIPAALASRGDITPLKSTVPPKPQMITYKVESGDSLSAIASMFNTDVRTLAELNDIAHPELLQVGQQIKVPSVLQSLSTKYTIKQVLNIGLTAYTAGFESTGKNPGDPDYGITATGAHVKDGDTIAVDPNVIPLGTKVYIEGIGVRTAEDTGGAIKGNRIDVYMNDLNAALDFGFKPNVKVYVLQEKPKDSDNSAQVAAAQMSKLLAAQLAIQSQQG